MRKKNILIILAVAAVLTLPLLMFRSGKAGFAGADDQAKGTISDIRPDYEPWFSPIWEPPSGEVASMLFSLQAAIGAGVLGYFFGLARGKAQARKASEVKRPVDATG